MANNKIKKSEKDIEELEISPKISIEITEKSKNIITILLIIFSFILVGTPIKYNCLAVNVITIILGIIILGYKIIRKEKLQFRKIDFVIFLFYISPIIPLIFGKCSSVQDFLIEIVRNISLFNFYICLKENIKNQNQLLYAILAGGFILAILGIDERTFSFIYKYLDKIGIPMVTNIENRMFSSLGYANSFAIIMAVEILISIYLMKNQKNKKTKILYCMLTILFGICLILSYSRTVIALTILILFIYAVFIKKQKKYIIVAIAGTITMYVFYIAGLKFDKPLTMFETPENTDSIRRDIYGLKPQKEYNFKFDIDAKSRLETVNNYEILIAEEDKYYDTIAIHNIKFSNYQGEKEIKFTPSENMVKMVIYFNTKSHAGQKGLTVKSLKINDRKLSLNYVFLPIRIVEKVQSFNVKDKSVWERGVYFVDSLKIIKNNYLFGTGARGWLYNYQNVQSYVYSSTEAHSFILQIFINNGIIGFVTLVIIIFYAIIKIIKKKRNINEIDIAFILLTIHSLIDFDMSFYCIMMLWITLFKFSTYNSEKETNKSKKEKVNLTKNANIIISSFLILINIIALIESGLVFKTKKENETRIGNISKYLNERKYNETINEIKLYCKNEKYNQFNEELEQIDYSKISDENLEYVYQFVKKQPIIVNTDTNMLKNEIINKIITTTKNKEYAMKFAKIVIEENEEIIKNILDQDKNRLPSNQVNQYVSFQRKLCNYCYNIFSESEVRQIN